MNDETIQQDVSDQYSEAEAAGIESEAIEASDPISRREAKMAQLAEARQAEQSEDRKNAYLQRNPDATEAEYAERLQAQRDAVIDLEEETPPLEATAGDEPLEAAGDVGSPEPVGAKGEADPAPNNGWRTNEAGDRVKTLMVNGEAREMTEDQYDRLLQKDLAGDQKLRMAAETERLLAEKAQELEARERRLAEASSQPPPGAVNEDLEVKIAQHTELLLEGDTDAANRLMAEIISTGRGSSTPNIDDLATQVATQVEARASQRNHEESVQDGWKQFQADYSDVIADQDALAFADIQVKNIRAAEPELSPKEVILKAGQITRERLHLSGVNGSQDQGQDAEPDELRADRKSRKANLKPMPRVGGKPRPLSKEPQLDTSPEAKIARMRKARAV